MLPLLASMPSVRNRIAGRIYAKPAGWAFTPKDFSDLGSRPSVNRVLHDLALEGTIRRMARGLYWLPRIDPFLKAELKPTHEQVAQAVARKNRWKIIPDGATAANTLGLSQQIPAKVVYLSSGPTQALKVDGLRIQFKHAMPKQFDFQDYGAGVVVQALRCLGKENIERWMVRHLARVLPGKVKRSLVAETRYNADWIYRLAQRIHGTAE